MRDAGRQQRGLDWWSLIAHLHYGSFVMKMRPESFTHRHAPSRFPALALISCTGHCRGFGFAENGGRQSSEASGMLSGCFACSCHDIK